MKHTVVMTEWCTFSGGGRQAAVYIIRFLCVSETTRKGKKDLKNDTSNTSKGNTRTVPHKKYMCRCVCHYVHVAHLPTERAEYTAFHINQQNYPFLLMHTSLQTNTILQHHKTHLWIIQHWNRHHCLPYPKKSSWLARLLQVYWGTEHPVPCCGC